MVGIRIFISYRHGDSQEDVYLLYQQLTRFFGNTLTLLDDNSLNPGANFLMWIEKSIKLSDVVLVIIGKDWLTITDEDGNRKLSNPNDFVVLEIKNALKYNKKIIPVILSGAKIPKENELPEAISKLAYINAVRLPKRSSDGREWGTRVSQIVSAIEKEFPFYKDRLLWIMAFIWAIIISITAFFSNLIVSIIASQFHIFLPKMQNEFYCVVITGIVWAARYVISCAKDYSVGKAEILLLPVAPYTNIFESINGFLNVLFLSFPFNIFFAWLISDVAAYLIFTYLHLNFEYSFLCVYAIATLLITFIFSELYTFRSFRAVRYQSIYKSETNYESFVNKAKLEEEEKQMEIRRKKWVEGRWRGL
jgi:hypothetical protein